MNRIEKRLEEKKYLVKIDDSVAEIIANSKIDKNYGARPLKRAIQSMLEDKIAESILDGIVKPGKVSKAIVIDDDVKIIENKN